MLSDGAENRETLAGNILSGCLRLGLFKLQHYLVWINFAGKTESRRWYFCWKYNALAQTVCLIIKFLKFQVNFVNKIRGSVLGGLGRLSFVPPVG